MARNLNRLTNAANRIEATRDWNQMAALAARMGRDDLTAKYKPADDAGWRKIDKATAALRAEITTATQDTPQ